MSNRPTRTILLLPLLLFLPLACVDQEGGEGDERGAGGAAAAPPRLASPESAPPPDRVIAPEGTRIGNLPFSPGIRAGDFIYLSGAIGTRRGTAGLVSDDVGEQTRQTLANIETVLEAADAGLEDVVKCTVFLVDMADYGAMNEVYAQVWPGDPPARSTMAGSGLALGAKVEIECIAYAPAVQSP